METIFDFSPTTEELKNIGIDAGTLLIRHGVNVSNPVTKENYKVDNEFSFFYIALLHIYRFDNDLADKYFEKIPAHYKEWVLENYFFLWQLNIQCVYLVTKKFVKDSYKNPLKN